MLRAMREQRVIGPADVHSSGNIEGAFACYGIVCWVFCCVFPQQRRPRRGSKSSVQRRHDLLTLLGETTGKCDNMLQRVVICAPLLGEDTAAHPTNNNHNVRTPLQCCRTIACPPSHMQTHPFQDAPLPNTTAKSMPSTPSQDVPLKPNPSKPTLQDPPRRTSKPNTPLQDAPPMHNC